MIADGFTPSREANRRIGDQSGGTHRARNCQLPGRYRPLIGLSFALLIGAGLSGAASAGEPLRVAAVKQANKPTTTKWKGDRLSAYGNRFKAALKVQAREAGKPSWSWACEERETVAMKTN